MKRLNTIFTDAEYIAQGFKPEEVPEIRRCDILYNKMVVEGWTADEEAEYYSLAEKLRI